jgi:hypothetical protein
MTTLAINAANFAASAATQAATTLALSAANSAISNIFDNRQFEGPQLQNFYLQTSQDGAPMARVYGRVRLAGQVIWASRLRETSTEEEAQSGKGGGPTQTHYQYSISFAIGLCEGKILGVDRLWANGAPLQKARLTMRVYKGTDTQLPDPIISAIEVGDVPAFRGTAYLVFEDFPLEGFGTRLPQINAKVIRVPRSQSQTETQTETPKLENQIKSVNLLPATGEFAYAATIVEETPEPGVSRPINMNNLSGQADVLQALDQLEDQLPNCKHVSVVTAWFGDSLDCETCSIRPAVERRDRILPEAIWSVAGETRNTAYLISSDAEGRPNFGGTPSDETIRQTIIELKRRGFKVTLYPFLLMDIPDGPQPFPWRGRISGDEGAAAPSQVANFFDGPNGFKNYILHYAQLAQSVGGVDGFVIGTEMRGLTTLRGPKLGGVSSYPAVDHFIDLAGDVKALLGASCAVTYAADWSEYFGHHPTDGSGDVNFHLDPLWASPDIDTVGIDAYFPLSDWRDGPHLDEALASDVYDPDYLSSQVEGGEGYDYFYATQAERDSQTRTPITDSTVNKPWVFRYKDLKNWWSQPHYNRVGGAEVSQATAWTPESKPFTLLEIGCPAVKYGANQPNVFYDAKSSESALPHYSDGTRDDLMQRRYLEALISYWDKPENNPVSSQYSGRMIDTEAMSVWAWDARPFPDFPARADVWADGQNWQTGHWISGRLGLVPLADILRELAAETGLTDIDTTQLNGLVQGFQIERPMSARAAISLLSELYSFSLAEQAGRVSFFSLGQGPVTDIVSSSLVGNIKGPIERFYEDPYDRLRDVRLHFIDAGAGYQRGLASAKGRTQETEAILDIQAPVVMDKGYADYLSGTLMTRLEAQNERVTFSLSAQNLEVQVGDRFALPNLKGVWRVASLEGNTVLNAVAQREVEQNVLAVNGAAPETTNEIIWPSRPVGIALELPASYSGLAVGSIMEPFAPTHIEAGGAEVTVLSKLHIGALLTHIAAGPLALLDRHSEFEMRFDKLALSSHSELGLLNGANRFAVETDKGWDIIQAAEIELVGAGHYRCRNILRGVGSEGYSADGVSAGARLVWLKTGVETLDVSPELIGETLALSAEAEGRENLPADFTFEGRHLKPLSPVHLKAEREGTSLNLGWIRRGRVNADSWVGDIPLGENEERYRVRLWNGETLLDEHVVYEPRFHTLRSDIAKIDIAQGSDAFGWGEAAILFLT